MPRVRVRGRDGERLVPLDEFHRLPGDRPQRDTNLRLGDFVLAVELPPPAFATRYHYLKVRDRASDAFALVSAAVGLQVVGDTIRSARIALGGVAHKPWYARKASERLAGLSIHAIDTEIFGQLAIEGAKPLAHNEYKVTMAKNAVSFALKRAMDVRVNVSSADPDADRRIGRASARRIRVGLLRARRITRRPAVVHYCST